MNRLSNLLSIQSIQRLLVSFIQNYRRFPLTLLCSLAVTALLFYLFRVEALDHEIYELNQWRYVQITMVLSLGIPLFFSVEVKPEAKKVAYYLAITLFLGIFAWSGDWDSKDVNLQFIIRFIAFSVMAHLTAAFLPFLLPINQKINGFWQYNKTLFIRIITAFLYTGTLFLGLSLALFGIETLFDFDLPRNVYLHLWIFLNVFCNTHFFVGGITKEVEDLENDQEYPIGLKYFTQYVLLALVVIYMVILYFYEFKIIAAWNLPKGWVSVLVIACAVFGILAFLLVYPLRTQNEWIKRYTKVFYYALLPLLGLLAVAIYVRINEYGITEPRYFVILLTLWLIGITFYFIISKVDNIKIIPISLAILALLSTFGPWGAFSVSERTQYNRLVKVLEDGKFLKDGLMYIPREQKLDAKQTEIISSVLDYFSKKHDLSTIQPLFKQDLNGLDTLNHYEIKNKLVAYGGGFELNKIYNTYYRYFYTSHSNPIKIEGYKYLIELHGGKGDFKREITELGSIDMNSSNQLFITKNEKEEVLIDLNNFIEKITLHKSDFVNENELILVNETATWKIKFYIDNLTIEKNEHDKNKVMSWSGKILLSPK